MTRNKMLTQKGTGNCHTNNTKSGYKTIVETTYMGGTIK